MLRARLLRDGEPGDAPGTSPAGGGGTPPAGGAGTGDDQLGEGGKAAIDRERVNAREANRLKTAAEQRAETAEAELARIREAIQSEAEKATANAVNEATAAAVTAGNTRLVRAEVKAAAAAAGFVDPRDAALLVAGKVTQVKVDKRRPGRRGRGQESRRGPRHDQAPPGEDGRQRRDAAAPTNQPNRYRVLPEGELRVTVTPRSS
jgi:hypothetical protein